MIACRWLLVLVLCCAACAPNVPHARTALDAARLKLAESLHARERAPELWLSLEAALGRAEAAAQDPARRADETAVARLWLEAAIAECQRADLAAKRLTVEREIEALVASALSDQRATKQLTDEAARTAAARIARDEAANALERAARTPSQRPKLDRATEASAARALLTRAELVLEAARALSADAHALAEARGEIERARSTLGSRPDVSLEVADRALSQALRLLGPLRARQANVTDAEKQALKDELDTLGGRVSRDDRGMSIGFESVFGAGDRLGAPGALRLSRLCALTVAHPHGAVQLLARAPNARAASARRAALRAALPTAGCVGERVALDTREGEGPQLELTWLAY